MANTMKWYGKFSSQKAHEEKNKSIRMWVVKQPAKENSISVHIWIAEVILMLRGLNVDAHFCKSLPKSPWGRKPNKKQNSKAYMEESPMKTKAQRPTKKTKEQERSKERNVRESDLQQNADL